MYLLQLLFLTFVIVPLIFHKILIKCEPDWTYDLVSIDIENNTPDIVYIDLFTSRVSRGVLALSGTIDFKNDITDELFLGVTLYYSPTGSLNFIKSPLHIPESNISTILNNYYKELAMESISKCCKNAPKPEKDKFFAPITKRKMNFENCMISNKEMPSKLNSGYYKVIFAYKNQAEGTIKVLIKVEQM